MAEVFHLQIHFHFVGVPVLLSVKVTFNGAFPEVEDAEKAATGFAVTVIYFDFVTLLIPAALETVSVTVYFPAL